MSSGAQIAAGLGCSAASETFNETGDYLEIRRVAEGAQAGMYWSLNHLDLACVHGSRTQVAHITPLK